jgi:rhamnulose-1-phosphate aldolase
MTGILQHNQQFQEVISGIAETAGFLWDKGWAERNAGNISVNITGLLSREDIDSISQVSTEPIPGTSHTLSGQVILITVAGCRMRDLARHPYDHLCLIRMDESGTGFQSQLTGNRGTTAGRRPTSELPTHRAIHEMLFLKKPGINAVIHAHSTELIALTHIPEFKSTASLNRLLWSMHPETTLFVPEGAGFIPYLITGSDSIAGASSKTLENHPVVVWEKHGVIATGKSVGDAFDTLDILSKAARIYFLVMQTGVKPEGLTDVQLAELMNP